MYADKTITFDNKPLLEIKSKSFSELIDKKPEYVITQAVKGMLPKNRLGRKLIKKLKVYSGTEHPHSAQKPETISLMEK